MFKKIDFNMILITEKELSFEIASIFAYCYEKSKYKVLKIKLFCDAIIVVFC